MPHFEPLHCASCGGVLRQRYVPVEERNRHVCEDCGEIRYVNPLIVAGTIPTVGNAVWLLRRAIEPRLGAWTFPAGYMEMGETVEDAARRETREELGVDVHLGRLLNLYSRPATSSVLAVYLAETRGDPAGGTEALEIALFDSAAIPWSDLAFWNTEAALRDWVSTLTESAPA